MILGQRKGSEYEDGIIESIILKSDIVQVQEVRVLEERV